MPAIHVIGTIDSKGRELAFIAERIRAAGGTPVLVDVGTKDAPTAAPDIAREVIADAHPRGRAAVLGLTDRGQAVAAMSEALAIWLRRRHDAGELSGAIGIGGTGGTSLIAPALRGLPIGVPKLLVSTVASGNTAAYVGASDLVLLPAVVDVAGLNQVSRQILGNAAHAISGMVANRQSISGGKPTLGLTMFGVTTPCVTAVRERLEADGYDCLVFHSTGTGGRAMEQLVADGLIGGVLDLTTTEVADEIAGGIFPAGPARFDVIIEKRIPYVMSLGALDMVNFGARDSVPAHYAQRKLHVHNPQITLMRTTVEENRACARFIAAKLNRAQAPVELLLPEKSTSLLSEAGKPFHDPAADAALIDELTKQLTNPHIRITRLPLDLNDPAFAAAAVGAFQRVVQEGMKNLPQSSQRAQR
jgi:uncharacterized protein (UPF0261 family)